jgi:hypothetical protein
MELWMGEGDDKLRTSTRHEVCQLLMKIYFFFLMRESSHFFDSSSALVTHSLLRDE